MPAPYSAGSIFLQVVPSFRGVPEQIAREAREWGDSVGKGLDEGIQKGVDDGIKKAGQKSKPALEKAGTDAGEAYSGKFRESMSKGIQSAQRELESTPLKLALNDEPLRRTLDKVRRDMKSLDRQVKLGMDAGGSVMELRRILGILADVQKKAQNVELRSNVAGIHKDLAAVEKHIQSLSGIDIEPDLKIDRQLGQFERRLRTGIKAAMDSLPPLNLDDGPAYAKVEALRERLLSLDRDVQLGVDSAQAFAELVGIEGVLHDIADTADNMKLRVDGAQAFTTVAALRTELEALSRMTIEPDIKLDRQFGAFERGLRGAIDSALNDLGAQRPGTTGDARVDNNAGQRAVMDLRQRLNNLGDLEIGVDISAEGVREQVALIRDELEKLQREHWSVDIDADTAAASTKLTAFLAALDLIDGQTATVDIDVKDAASAITVLNGVGAAARKAGSGGNDGANSFRAFNIRMLGVAALGPLVVPALGAIAGALAALGPLAAVSAAGIGVLIFSLMGVGAAVKAMSAARSSAARDQAVADKAATNSARTVADAQRAVGDAHRNAADAATSASRAVTSALRGVEDAERSVRDAQKDRLRAQEDLTQAVKDAKEAQEDLSLSLRDSRLDEVKAGIDLREAQAALRKGMAAGATGDDLLKLQYNVDKYALSLDTAKERTGDLQQQTDEFAKSGVEGSSQVVAARDRIAQADQRIADAQRGLQDAQQRVADARAEQARSALDSQRAIADAQRNLAEAQADYTAAIEKTSTAQDKLNQAMNDLSPAGRDFATFIDGLKPKLQYLRGLAQKGLLPGLSEWIDSIVTGQGPLLESTIGRISGAIGGMFSQFAKSIQGPQFTALFQMIDRSGPAFIGMMGTVLTNLGEGVASLITAMEPLAYLFGQWLVDATASFKEWAGNLQGSTGLRHFFEYIAEITPKVAEFLMSLAKALVQIGIALAPYAGGLLKVFDVILGFIAGLDPAILGPITVAIVGTVLALQGIFAVTAGMKSLQTAVHILGFEIDGLSKATWRLLGPWAILAVALATLYATSDSFRAVVDSLWHDVLEPLAEMLGAMLEDILVPLFQLLGDNIEIVAGIAAAWASWKIILQVVTWIESLRGALIGLAIAQGAVGAGAAGGIMGSVTSKVGMGGAAAGIGTAAGAAAGGAALGVAALSLGARKSTDGDQEAWVKALRAGGADAEKARADMGDTTYWERLTFNLGHWGNTQKVVSRQAAETNAALKDQWTAMSPLEQAQSKVAEWTATLADRTQRLGEEDEKTVIAHQQLTYWTKQVDLAQGGLDTALSKVNQALLTQQNLALSMTEADLAFDRSTTALADAHQAVADALKNNGANSKEYRDALAALEDQQYATATAAGRVSDSRHADADAAEKQQFSNAAILANLIAQEEQYGKLPPRLQQLKDQLLQTVPAAYLAEAQMQNLGLAVVNIPNNKEIVISGDTPQAQLDKITALGLHVEQLPNGDFAVTANTDEAQTILDQFINTERSVMIGADVVWNAITQRRNRENQDFADQFAGSHATGGHIRGPGTWTSDSIPAWLSNNEFVVRAASVAKYGLPLLNAINEGRLGEGMGFSSGGQAKRRKGGLPAFADGGSVASGAGLAVNWGGSMTLQGGNVSPLADAWWQAVAEINQAAAAGLNIMAKALNIFAKLANGAFMSISRQTAQSWQSLLAQTIVALDQLNALTNSKFLVMRVQAMAQSTQTVYGIKGIWDLLPGFIVGPVNTIIDKVLNGGLLSAFNNIAGQLGVPTKALKATPSVKLAAGGPVPGWSPHDKADNIPAWLTAGEFVQPVDVVDHYGVDFMERLRKKELPRYATGGYVGMSNVIKQQFPWARITSAYRPGDPGYHGKGQAIDIAGSLSYPDKAGMKQMLEINRWIAAHFANITELIHTDAGAINLWHGMPHTYNAATQAEHRNHVHWAMAGALLAGGGSFPGMSGFMGDPSSELSKAVEAELAGFDDSPMKNLLAEVPRKLVGLAAERLNAMIADAVFAGDDAAFSTAGVTGNAAANKSLVEMMAKARGWTGAEFSALDRLIMKESGYNNTAQNPSSTAFGMFQFLNSTWGQTGISKTADPRGQTEAGFRYIASRYGSPSKALAFHLAHNWYGDGGEVKANQSTDGGAIIPDLHDTGGWVEPGLNVLMNRTRKPEAVINPQTLDALLTIADRGMTGGDRPSVTIPVMNGPTAREISEEFEHRAVVASRGGKYR